MISYVGGLKGHEPVSTGDDAARYYTMYPRLTSPLYAGLSIVSEYSHRGQTTLDGVTPALS